VCPLFCPRALLIRTTHAHASGRSTLAILDSLRPYPARESFISDRTCSFYRPKDCHRITWLVTGDTVRAAHRVHPRSRPRSSAKQCHCGATGRSRRAHMTTFWHCKRHSDGVAVPLHAGKVRCNSHLPRFCVSACNEASCLSRDGVRPRHVIQRL
jgi:hypothetical protein